jgi:nitroreductase
VDLLEALRTTGTCRYYTGEPVPDELLARAFEAARFAPQGGNMQPVRWLVVRDRDKLKTLAGWYLEVWEVYLTQVQRVADVASAPLAIRMADDFARALKDIPALVVVCFHPSLLYATDGQLDRDSVVGGASIYPTVEAFLLACRALGLGTAITTLLVSREPEVKELLSIPDDVATAAHVAVGHPARPWPTKLQRRPVEKVVFADTYGEPLITRAE